MRQPLSLVVPDASRFARSLGQALKTRHQQCDPPPPPPGHVELLNLIARALGHRNLQALQVAAASPLREPLPEPYTEPLPEPLPAPPLALEDQPPPLPLSANARKALQQFDSRGRLLRWPHKFSVQKLAMWVLWSLFEGQRSYTEREVNEVLKAANAFGDHVTLRRELINHRLMSRKDDCSDYRKLPVRPDDEARALLQAWRAQRRRSQPRRTAPPGETATATTTANASASAAA